VIGTQYKKKVYMFGSMEERGRGGEILNIVIFNVTFNSNF